MTQIHDIKIKTHSRMDSRASKSATDRLPPEVGVDLAEVFLEVLVVAAEEDLEVVLVLRVVEEDLEEVLVLKVVEEDCELVELETVQVELAVAYAEMAGSLAILFGSEMRVIPATKMAFSVSKMSSRVRPGAAYIWQRLEVSTLLS